MTCYNTFSVSGGDMLTVAGLISGTSADGIDVTIAKIGGAPPNHTYRVIYHATIPYDPAVRAEIFAAFRPESSSVDRLTRLNATLGEVYAAAILQVIRLAGLTPDDIDLIGSHGQTVWYEPPTPTQRGAYLALGDGATIAERTGITTISNLRARDLAAGGYGAPLVSYLDWLLFRDASKSRVLQNIGGIGNLTYLPPLGVDDVAPVTFDTGPGNMIIDYCAQRATNGAQTYDTDGKIAASGRVHSDLLFGLLAHPYLHQKPPKATGRELFGVQFAAEVWAKGQQLGLSAADIVATATAFTAESILAAYRDFLPTRPDEVYLAGGGAHNPTLCKMLQAGLGDTPILPHESLGVAPAAKEGLLFALLAYETWHGRPGTLPVLTGAAHPVPLGEINPGRKWGGMG